MRKSIEELKATAQNPKFYGSEMFLGDLKDALAHYDDAIAAISAKEEQSEIDGMVIEIDRGPEGLITGKVYGMADTIEAQSRAAVLLAIAIKEASK